MFKILSATVIIVAFLTGGILLFGFRAGPEIKTSLFLTLDYRADYLYDLISNISKYPDRKKDMINLEILEKQGTSIVKWRENYPKGLWREYELIEKKPPKYFSLKLTQSSDTHSGLIEYSLNQKDTLTEVILTETGRIENVFWRGLHYLAGEDSFLEKQAKWLRVAILSELLKRK